MYRNIYCVNLSDFKIGEAEATCSYGSVCTFHIYYAIWVKNSGYQICTHCCSVGNMKVICMSVGERQHFVTDVQEISFTWFYLCARHKIV